MRAEFRSRNEEFRSQCARARSGRRLSAGAAILAVLLTGCAQAVDRAALAVRQDFHSAAALYAAANDVFLQGADELAAKKHVLQEQLVSREWDAFLARHTDDAGGLVSRDEAGQVVPMPVEQLMRELEKREQATLAVALSRNSWTEFRRRQLEATAKFKATNELLAAEEIKTQEARESAAATWNAVLGALGAAAGIAAGAAAP